MSSRSITSNRLAILSFSLRSFVAVFLLAFVFLPPLDIVYTLDFRCTNASLATIKLGTIYHLTTFLLPC